MDKCKNCGAELTADNSPVQKCSYCGSTYNVNTPVLPENVVQHKVIEEIKPRYHSTTIGTGSNSKVSDFEMPSASVNSNQLTFTPMSPGARKFQLYTKTASLFLLLWIGLYFFRFNMPDGKTNLSQHHNLIFSPIGGDYWWIRGALLLGLFPLGVALLIYNTKYKNK